MTEHQSSEEGAEGLNVVQRIVNAWDCCGTCAGGVLAAHMREAVAAVQAEADGWRGIAKRREKLHDSVAEVEAAHGRALVDLADAIDRAESAEAESARLRARLAEVEALADPAWRANRGHEYDTTSEAFAAGRNEAIDDLRSALAHHHGAGPRGQAMNEPGACVCPPRWITSGGGCMCRPPTDPPPTKSLRAVLASPSSLAQRDAEVGARALREAADELWRVFLRLPHTPSPVGDYVQRRVVDLRARADALAAEAGGES